MRTSLRRPWSPQEERELRLLAATISPMRIAVRLKRTRTGILSHAAKLKVRLLAKPRRRRPGHGRADSSSETKTYMDSSFEAYNSET
jgi:hypothetical protein